MARTSWRPAGAALVAATLAATTAVAQPRPLTTNMTCAAASALVSARGAVVLGTGPHTYDRYVAHPGFCDRGQGYDPAFERTADSAQCFVGYRCRGRAGNGARGN